MDQNGKMICISALFGIDAPEGAAVFVETRVGRSILGMFFIKGASESFFPGLTASRGFKTLAS
ncbi:hypothetical protein [Ferrovum myxofaciens]|uniref:hypothetical protein n=1 Tax=Ferrovum myxofaciens TaxID=416213 RepID=UPI003EBF1C31